MEERTNPFVTGGFHNRMVAYHECHREGHFQDLSEEVIDLLCPLDAPDYINTGRTFPHYSQVFFGREDE